MSADDFHTKYASVMESMLKSAMAETTKLFETMVNDLKAEISQMRKENEDLKTRCVQYEMGPPVTERNRVPERSVVSGKCDTAVQCDLSPICTVIVEEHQPLRPSALRNQDHQLTTEQTADSFQKHSYICQANRDSNVASKFVIQESVLQKEEVEPSVAYRQVFSNNTGSEKASENASLHIVQRRASEEFTLPQNSLGNVKPSLIISLKDAFRDDIKEEPECVHMTNERKMQEKLKTPESQELTSPECHQNDSSAIDEKTEATVQKHTDVHSTEQQLTESALVRKEDACERLSDDCAKTSSQSKDMGCHKRGRPSKKRKVELIEPSSGSTEDKTSTKSSSVITSSVQENVSETPRTSKAASGLLKRHHSSVSLQDAMLLVDAMNQSPVESAISPSLITAQPQAHFSPLRRTSQTVTKTPVKPQICTPTVETYLKAGLPDVALHVKSATSSKDVHTFNLVAIPKQQHGVPPRCTTEQGNSTSAAVAAFLRAKTVRKGSQTIVILPGPGTSFAPPKITLASSLRLSSAATKTVMPQKSAGTVLPPKTPPLFSDSKSIKGTVEKYLPHLPVQTKMISTDQKSKTPQRQRITIIPPPVVPVGISPRPKPVDHTEKQDSTSATGSPLPTPDPGSDTNSAPDLNRTSDTEGDPGPNRETDPASVPDPSSAADPDPVPDPSPAPVSNPIPASDHELTCNSEPDTALEPDHNTDTEPNHDLVPTALSTQLISKSQQTNSSLSSQLTSLVEKMNNTIENLGNSKQATSDFEMIHVPTDTYLSPEVFSGQAAIPASLVLQSNAKQKLHPVVRLTRFPFPVTTKESILVSRLSEVLGKQKPSEQLVSVSEMPTLSHLKTSEKPQVSSTTGTVPDSPDKAASIALENNIDPHLQMTKTQFLEQLLVSPVAQEKESSTYLHAEENRHWDKNSLPETSIVARLRNHIKSHLETRTTAKKMKTHTEIKTKGPKECKLDNDYSNDGNGTTSSNMITSTPLFNSLQSGMCGDSTTASMSVGELSLARSGKTTLDPAAVKVKRFSSESDSLGSNNIKSTFSRQSKSKEESPSPKVIRLLSASQVRETSDSDDANSINKISPSSSLRMTRCTQESIHPKIIISTSRAKSTKSSSMSPKMSTREGIGLESTLSVSVSLHKIPEGLSYPSSYAIPEASTSIKSITSQSSCFSPGKYPQTTVSAKTEKSEREGISQSVEGKIDAEIFTPSRQTEGHSGSGADLKIINATKMTKAAKAQKRKGSANMRRRITSKVAKRELTENQGETGVVRKCRAVVWYPPRLPPNEMPSLERKKPKPVQVVDKVPLIPFNKTPIVSPLQPLAVIGKFLLRNQCGECGRIFSSSSALESHVSLHKARQPFSCMFCGKSFPDSKSFKRHNRVHRNGRIHICPKCGKGFVYRFGLSKHLQMVHSKIKPFICQICSKGFHTKRDVEIHIRIHTGEKPFHCHLCEKKFTRRVELNVHLRWHNGEKRHWCPYCGKGFLDSNNLKRHKYTHTGEKPYSCPYCSRKFTQTGHMKKHIRNTHENK